MLQSTSKTERHINSYYLSLETTETDSIKDAIERLQKAISDVEAYTAFLGHNDLSTVNFGDECEDDHLEDKMAELDDELTRRFRRYLQAMAILGRRNTRSATTHVAMAAANMFAAYDEFQCKGGQKMEKLISTPSQIRDHFLKLKGILRQTPQELADMLGVKRQTIYQYGFEPGARGARTIPAASLDLMRCAAVEHNFEIPNRDSANEKARRVY